MLKRIDTYIIKKFIGTYIFSITLILSISIIFDINEKISNFLNPEVTLHEIVFDYYLNFIPYYMNMFSALFTFIAVIFFTSKLADNSEVIAMLAAGISFRRLMRPYMISAALIAILSFILGSYIIPPSSIERLAFLDKYIDKNKTVYASSIQLAVEPGVIAYFDRYDVKVKRGYRFSLEKFEDKKLVSRVTARRISYDSAYHWKLHNYTERRFEGMRERVRSGEMLDTTIHIVPSDFMISDSDSEQMSTPELRRYINRQRERGIGNITAFELEYHKRFAMPMSAFILTIIGASLSSRKIKGGMGLNIGIGLLLSFGYIFFMTISSTFAISGQMSPMFAVWLPNISYIFIAIYLYTKAPR